MKTKLKKRTPQLGQALFIADFQGSAKQFRGTPVIVSRIAKKYFYATYQESYRNGEEARFDLGTWEYNMPGRYYSAYAFESEDEWRTALEKRRADYAESLRRMALIRWLENHALCRLPTARLDAIKAEIEAMEPQPTAHAGRE